LQYSKQPKCRSKFGCIFLSFFLQARLVGNRLLRQVTITMSERSSQQRRIQSMALALAEQLSRVFPNYGPLAAALQQDSPHFKDVVKQWLAQLLEESGLILPLPSKSSSGSSSTGGSGGSGDVNTNGNTVDEIMTSPEYQEIQMALSMAIAQWKAQPSSPNLVPTETTTKDDDDKSKNETKNTEPDSSKKSFSWLDQFLQQAAGGGGSLLYNFVSIDDIVQAPSDQERLIILQKVSHVDDILLDWSQVLPLVRQGLLYDDIDDDDVHTIMRMEQKEDDNNNNNNNKEEEGANQKDSSSSSLGSTTTKAAAADMALKYLQLHRTWFDQGRMSTEHVGLQYDLCRNVMVAIQKRMVTLLTSCTTTTMATTTTTTSSSAMAETASLKSNKKQKWDQDTLLMHQVQTWHDMWLDIMQRGLYSEEAAQDMEITMFLWMRDFRDSTLTDADESTCTTLSSSSSSSLPLPLSLPSHIILALLDPQSLWLHSWTNLVSIQRLMYLLEHTSVLPSVMACAANPPRISANTNNNNNEALCHALYLHSLSTLRAILVRTRVSHFPWHLLLLPPPQQQQQSESAEVFSITNLVDTASRIGVAIQAKGDADHLAGHSSSSSDTTTMTSSIPTIKKNHQLLLLDVFMAALEFITKNTTTRPTSVQRDNNGDRNHDTVDWWIELCCDAMDTLLWGCKRHGHDLDMTFIQARLSSIHDKMTVGSPRIISAFCQTLDAI
jgi:hypothetical protein